jgi:hypothetical protein
VEQTAYPYFDFGFYEALIERPFSVLRSPFPVPCSLFTVPHSMPYYLLQSGVVSEWSKERAWKVCIRL